MIEEPLVSVIIPTYSRANYLCKAIDSVLRQTYHNIEIIVIDDNGKGTPNQLQTYESIKKYQINPNFHYIAHDINRNGAAARNTGIKHSKGKYICLLDDDDEYLPLKIEKQVKVMEELEDETWGGCYCNSYDYYSENKYKVTKNTSSGNLCAKFLLNEAAIGSNLIMIKHEICIELNGFDESFKRHQDWEFLIRFFRKYKMKLVEGDALVNYNYYIDESNRPKAEVLLEIEKQFLSTYKQDIINTGYGNEIFQLFLLSISISFFREFKYKKSILIFRKCISYNGISIRIIKYLGRRVISYIRNRMKIVLLQ
jgi:glycosyltransferase involved in cell wall biosynthesis